MPCDFCGYEDISESKHNGAALQDANVSLSSICRVMRGFCLKNEKVLCRNNNTLLQ